MLPLAEDLKQKKNSLIEFAAIAKRVLQHLPDVLTSFEEKNGYRLYVSKSGSTTKHVRPINYNIFIPDPESFADAFGEYEKITLKLKNRELHFNKEEKNIINNVLYTIQQSIGVGLDLFVNPNSARKHVGNRFEELIKAIFVDLDVTNKKIVLQIPYETDEGKKIYKCETDLILSPYTNVKSTNKYVDEKEVIVSVKTTSKDRMGKIFMDRILMEHFVGHNIKMIGLFLNDVQRKENNNISYTLVSGLFMVYTKFLKELEGVYYFDAPPNAFKSPYKRHMKPFSELLTKDLWELLTP
ncbi:hypothetical protein C900_03837 [Fulvivirga imtechensis AK7]|uniref:Uncharacterized protein n=1 Tax=Fulvivirga imtechensis AK7 TaxID=1237149 RepID=L8JS02_9BACT|nr:hypothetical protein [Fulvivirga imtechensis]ELR70152.1 hypothetical protein C900_03837 [Fulvivirga imtechensis AK7]